MGNDVTVEEFQELQQNGNIVVKFYADWCGPCQKLGPVFDAVAENVEEAEFVSLNVEKAQSVLQQFGVRSVPTLLVLKDGNVQDMQTGYMEEAELQSWVQQHV